MHDHRRAELPECLQAVTAASGGIKVSLWEKNEKLGKKLFITGKGRCNLTNNCETEALFQNVMTNSKFLYSAFYQFNSRDLMTFFETEGLRLKTEREIGYFPSRTSPRMSFVHWRGN